VFERDSFNEVAVQRAVATRSVERGCNEVG
jgi:hypothetical protein